MRVEAIVEPNVTQRGHIYFAVTSILTAVALLFALGCGSSAPSSPAADPGLIVVGSQGTEITLKSGGAAELPSVNLRVGFSSVDSDSRCPSKALVQCVWAGSVIVGISVGPINGERPTQLVKLETVAGRDTATVQGHLIRLVKVLPEKEFIEPIPLDLYRIVLMVDGPPRP